MSSPRMPPRRRTRRSPARPCSARRPRWSRSCVESGELMGEPTPIGHVVKFFENGDKPLEIVASRQWYITNGGRDEELRAACLHAASRSTSPRSSCGARRRGWVGGHRPISRQRFFGVPIPVWYQLDAADEKGAVIVPSEDSLLIDPASATAPGYDERPARGARAVCGEVDVMGHLGDLVAHPAARRRLGARPGAVRPRLPVLAAPPGPGHHPHLVVLYPDCAPSSSTAPSPWQQRRHHGTQRPGPQENVQVQGHT